MNALLKMKNRMVLWVQNGCRCISRSPSRPCVWLGAEAFCHPMDCWMPVLPVHHQLPEFTQAHVYWVNDAIQPSHPPSSPSPPAFNLSQHQGLFQWVSSSHQVAKVLEFQLQHQSFQWLVTQDSKKQVCLIFSIWKSLGIFAGMQPSSFALILGKICWT